ncbi:MAG: hypothetical protein GEU28_14350 [Dehalococcoidia bacterium]|nr:hypothetical protein [Dehalococcoidia bacterium]
MLPFTFLLSLTTMLLLTTSDPKRNTMTTFTTPDHAGLSARSPAVPAASSADAELQKRVVGQLQKRAQFRAHVRVYLLVNALHVVVWAAIFAITGVGFFWPIFPAVGWAIGLGFNAWDVHRGGNRRQVPAGEEIRHEMDALRANAQLGAVGR